MLYPSMFRWAASCVFTLAVVLALAVVLLT